MKIHQIIDCSSPPCFRRYHETHSSMSNRELRKLRGQFTKSPVTLRRANGFESAGTGSIGPRPRLRRCIGLRY